jgi:hypothetical protein
MVSALRALFWTMAITVLAVAAPAEATTLNIVAVGASNTSGWSVGAESAYPAQLQALLRKDGIDANVPNAGVLGDVTAGMLGRLDAAVPWARTSSFCNRAPTIYAFSAPRRCVPRTSLKWCSTCARAASA